MDASFNYGVALIRRKGMTQKCVDLTYDFCIILSSLVSLIMWVCLLTSFKYSNIQINLPVNQHRCKRNMANMEEPLSRNVTHSNHTGVSATNAILG